MSSWRIGLACAPADRVPVERGNHQLGRVLKPQKHFVCMQTEVILKCRINAGQHADVGARGKEFVASAGEDDHVSVVLHPGLENRVIELAIHLVGIRVRRRIVHLDHRDSAIEPIVHQ